MRRPAATVVNGRVAYVVPVAPAGAPRAVRRALAHRRAATIHGACPACGAVGAFGSGRMVMEHEAVCPVGDPMLVRLLAEHGLRPTDLDRELVIVDDGVATC